MNLKSILFVFFVFIFTFTVASCSPGQTFGSTSTPSPTITATLTPAQMDTPTPEPSETTEATSTPSLLQGQLSGLAAAPDMLVDSTGLHITLPDSSRVIDIETADVAKEIVFDSEYSLYKIYDAKGNITVEYDPGQGREGDTDYVPATGWVDVQSGLSMVTCTNGCLYNNESRGFSNSVYFKFESTGIYRYKDVFDNTNNIIGNVLVLEVVSKDIGNKPTTAWLLVQAEKTSGPGINKFRGIAQGILFDKGMGLNGDGGKTFPIPQWLSWMPKDSVWIYSFSRGGRSYKDFLINGDQITYTNDASAFINSGGVNTQDVILVVNGQTSS